MLNCSLLLTTWNATRLYQTAADDTWALAWWDGDRYNITSESAPLQPNADVAGIGVSKFLVMTETSP
jgi:hypothetical protein